MCGTDLQADMGDQCGHVAPDDPLISSEQRRDEFEPPVRYRSVVEHAFADDRLAALYDLFHPPEAREDFAFYLPLILAAGSVLDVGCGTGALLRWAREAGHTGRLCGLDPAAGMLNQARVCNDIQWVLGDLTSIPQEREFELIVMTGHAFQELVNDEQIHVALAAIGSALTDTGRFAFETRNPLARAWEHWERQYTATVTDCTGSTVSRQYRVHLLVVEDVVHSSSTFTSSDWDRDEVSHGRLRFLLPETLSWFLSGAGLAIEHQFGTWDRQPLSDTCPEIITIARKRDNL